MGPIHKRLPSKFQVLIWMICLTLFSIVHGEPKPKEDAQDMKTADEVRSVIHEASKKQDFSKEMKQITQKHKEKAIPTLIAVFEDSSRIWQERWFSGMALSKFEQEKTRKVLIKGTKDPLSIIRSVSIQALMPFDDDESLEVTKKAIGDSSLLVRDTAVKSLGKREDRGSIDLLAKELYNEHNYYRGKPILGIRENIVIAIGNIGSMKGVDPLMKIFQQEPNTKIERLACRAMEKIIPLRLDDNTRTTKRECPSYWEKWYKETQESEAANKKSL